MYLEEYEEEPYDPLFLPLSEQKNKRRNPWRFLKIVGDVLKLDWLTHKTPEDRESTIQRLIPNFACRALEKDDFLSLQELLSHMDINDATYDGITVLHRACELGKTDMVLQLLSLGASCNLTDRFGCTPLHLAIKNKHHDVIRLLMLKDATVSQHPVRIAMDLMKAVRDNDDRLLCGWHLAGADMNQQDYNGRTALHTAVEKRNTRMVSKLLEYGATPEIPDVWQRTAVDEAAENDLHEISELFRQMK